jgi:hypothetical protein
MPHDDKQRSESPGKIKTQAFDYKELDAWEQNSKLRPKASPI